MSSAQDLAAGVAALFIRAGFVWVSTAGDPGGDGVRAFDSQVLGTPTHFVRVEQALPDVESRSLARTRHAHWCMVRATVTGVATEQVRKTSQLVFDALEGARPVAAGWLTSPIAELNTREPIEDRDAGTTAAGRYPVYATLEFEYTATLAAA